MKILIFNWKDIKNPLSGGAEVLTHEIAKYFVKKGHSVTLFVSSFDKGAEEEILDGVRIVRRGSKSVFSLFRSIYYEAYAYYQKNRDTVDVVIDEVHGIPFFTPLYVKKKIIVLQCEVAKDIWDKMFPFPLNMLGRITERLYFFLYHRLTFLVISESTRKDVNSMGIPDRHITVLPMGFNRAGSMSVEKERNPTVIFVGRLNKMKGIEDALQAFFILKKDVSQAKFWIVGRGEKKFVDNLKTIVKQNQFENDVSFLDFVSEKEKFGLMARAHIIVVPSIREGFGLIVPEAGSVGTPAIAFDVPGLRDLIQNEKNGLLVRKRSITDLAYCMRRLFLDSKLYNRLATNAISQSKLYNWEDTGRVALSVIES